MDEKVMDMFGKLVEEAIKHPELAPSKVVIISLSEEEQRNILTPRRLELIRTIKSEHPDSVRELARMVNRRVDAVSRDLKTLENYGFLTMLQIGKQKQPVVEKEVLLMPLTA